MKRLIGLALLLIVLCCGPPTSQAVDELPMDACTLCNYHPVFCYACMWDIWWNLGDGGWWYGESGDMPEMDGDADEFYGGDPDEFFIVDTGPK